jgi:Ser/Thr protein kinase RdoA (MazF antagonist)
VFVSVPQIFPTQQSMDDVMDMNGLGGIAIPAAYSTLSISAIVTELLCRYGIPEVRGCQFWRRGLSDVYWIETADGSSYILRISHHHWRSRSDVLYELEFLEHLHSHQVPVAYPLRTKAGELCLTVKAPEGDRFASLFICAPGSVPIGDLNLVQSRVLGCTVAQIHASAQSFQSTVARSPLDAEHLLDRSLGHLDCFLGDYPQQQQVIHQIAANLSRQLTALPKESPYWTVCWGDPHSGNTHFASDTALTLFDFDQCGPGWRAFELGKFLQVAMSCGVDRKVRRAFLEGYQSIAPLEEVELQMIRPLTQAAYLWNWSIVVNYAQFHDYCRLDAHHFRQRFEMFKMLGVKDCHLF